MSRRFSPLNIQHGTVMVNEHRSVTISADYPYYRDHPDNWHNRLSSLKSLGINFITIYIPWRHHQLEPGSPPDFTGLTQPNRNVLGFLEHCRELGLTVIAKPGPFIHAEVNYGGLPDWICPLNNPAIDPLTDAQGKRVYWSGATHDASGTAVENWPLPAPFSAEFLQLTSQWLAEVGENVIRPKQAPGGPITAIQIANEGIFSNGQHAPWAYDYSSSALRLYSRYLAEKYKTLSHYNQLHRTNYSSWASIPAPRCWEDNQQDYLYVDWGEFSAYYMDKVFQAWSAPLQTHLPILINQNPPLGTYNGMDAWLSRVEPERWRKVHFCFTNWIGDISANPSAFQRYVLTAKRAPGFNLEENWGFADLYDPAYADASTSLYQTLVILNNGATGFNVYTGVATATEDKNLEVIPKLPYPDSAPITESGELTPKAEIIRWLALFFERFGDEFLACRTEQPAAWGFYLPQARQAAWSLENRRNSPQHGIYLSEFQRQMRALRLDYGIVNLEWTTPEILLHHPYLYIAGCRCLASSVQKTLAEYVRRGGNLTVCGILPTLDENGAPCTTLLGSQTRFRNIAQVDVAEMLAYAPRPELIEGEVDIWMRSHPERDIHFVTLLIPANGTTNVRLSARIGNHKHQVKLSATPSGGAILRIENGRITDAIIKGQNTFLHRSVVPCCYFDDQKIGLEVPGDMVCLGDWTACLPSFTSTLEEQTH